jgi:hypothetical protein
MVEREQAGGVDLDDARILQADKEATPGTGRQGQREPCLLSSQHGDLRLGEQVVSCLLNPEVQVWCGGQIAEAGLTDRVSGSRGQRRAASRLEPDVGPG